MGNIYSNNNPLAPKDYSIIVSINEVDLISRVAHCLDKHDSLIQASFRQMSGINTTIPSPGESWFAQRVGFQWDLVTKLDNDEEHLELKDFNPGDSILRTSGMIRYRSEGIEFNSKPIGATLSERLTLASPTSSIVLTNSPIGLQTVQVFNNGSLIDPDEVSFDTGDSTNKTLSFSSSLATGWVAVYYQAV